MDLPGSIRHRVREVAKDRCGYCLSPQRYVMGKLEIEHIIPRAQGGSDKVLVTLLVDEERQFWVQASRASLDAIWDNPEDEVYARLLEE